MYSFRKTFMYTWPPAFTDIFTENSREIGVCACSDTRPSFSSPSEGLGDETTSDGKQVAKNSLAAQVILNLHSCELMAEGAQDRIASLREALPHSLDS